MSQYSTIGPFRPVFYFTKIGVPWDTQLIRMRSMFELGVFFVIFLAAAYWTVLWVMGRREDVLHGQFVEGDLPAAEPVTLLLPGQPAFKPDLLQSLLTSIKRDLDQLTRK